MRINIACKYYTQLLFAAITIIAIALNSSPASGMKKNGYLLFQENIVIKGIVYNEDGEPLSGVTVTDNRNNTSAVTADNGHFEISVQSIPVSLHFSSVGYENKDVAVRSSKEIKVFMKKKASQMDEVVVIGYSKVKKSDLTGSVVNVKMDDIKDEPVTSVDMALQGRIPGAEIVATSGEPGATTTIRIRGTRSITASNEPLIVVDGILDAINDLNDLNPTDIASISVLKDASATAIYGSRGSNGVIMITTKQGVRGTTRINLSSTYGISQLPRKLDIMDASQFAQYRNDYALFSTTDNNADIGSTTPPSRYPYPDPFSKGKGVDWVDLISRVGPFQKNYLTVSGGGEDVTYYASFGYDRNDGIIDKSDFQRLTGRLNLSYNIFKWATVRYNVNFFRRSQHPNLATIGGTNWWNGAIFLNPLMNVNKNFNDLWYSGQTFNSPRAILDANERLDKSDNTTHSFIIELNPLKHVTIESQLNFVSYAQHQFRFEPSTLPAKVEGEGGTAYRREYTSTNIMSQNTITYSNDLAGGHHFDILGGFIGKKFGSDNFSLTGVGYQSDFIKWNNMNAIPDKENFSASSSNASNISLSYLGRLNYNYKSKYYLTFTGRRDGASNFAENKKWAFFPSGAFKWTVSKEDFMQRIHWLDELSFRLSAGITGNDGVSNYGSLSQLGSTTGGYLFNDAQPVAFYPSRLASPNLTWEKTEMYNAAVDVSLLKGKLTFTLEAYRSRTTDLLLNIQVPVHTGYSTRLANVGKTSNEGLELGVNSVNVDVRNFTWTTSFSISHNRQKVIDISDVDFVPVFTSNGTNYMMYGYKAGYPLNSLWGFQYGGVWKSTSEVDRNKLTKGYVSTAPAKYTPGSPRYIDQNNDGQLNEDDIIYLGNADPYVYGGLQNTFNLKGFSFSFFFNYSLGGKIYNVTEQQMAGSELSNQYTFMLNGWHPIRNPNSDIPRAGGGNDQIASSRMVYSATFVRLKTVSLGYLWNTSAKTNGIIKDVRFSLSSENVYLWKRYNGFDPDVSSSGTSSTLRRADVGAYPKPRTFVVGVELRY